MGKNLQKMDLPGSGDGPRNLADPENCWSPQEKLVRNFWQKKRTT